MSLAAKIVLQKALVALRRAELELAILESEVEGDEVASNTSSPSTPSSGTSSSSRPCRGRPRQEPVIHWCDFVGCLVSNLPDGTGKAAFSAGALAKHKESRNCPRNYVPCSTCGVLVSTHGKAKHERTCSVKVAANDAQDAQDAIKVE